MKPLFILILIAFTSPAIAQKKVLFYDSDWKPSNKKKYAFIVEQKQINDTCFEWNYYEAKRPRYLSIQFKELKGGTPHGNYKVYTAEGYVDTSGHYLNGKKHGEWNVMASNHRLLYKLEYNNGELLSTKDSTQVNEERSRRIDSIKSLATKRSEIESEFPGGARGWQRYIANNVEYPAEAFKAEVQGIVHVQFIVEKDGRVSNVDLYKSAEYYLDEEALRLIAASPVWTPAEQDGRKVRSYKRQPVTFGLNR